MKQLLDIDDYTRNESLSADAIASAASLAGFDPPNDVVAFYTSSNGGTFRERQCRFLRLDEAIEIRDEYRDWLETFDLLPILVADHEESDPVCVVLTGPLVGHVYQQCHDLPCRVLATCIEGLIAQIAVTPAAPLYLDAIELSLSDNSSDQRLQIVNQLLDQKTKDGDADSLAFELALSMLSNSEVEEHFVKFHPDSNECLHALKRRLNENDSDAARLQLASLNSDQRDFVMEAMRLIRDAGYTPTTRTGLDIHVAEGNWHMNIPMFYERKGKADCWDKMMERVHYFAARHKKK
ncbi:hypothetical protein [Novipirellula caenicola]|uniref:Uncharacterized protein n=1 Tax=Novipirellula caenicola TaxID=1536901 RepID=A0ABP9VLV6_9BACT